MINEQSQSDLRDLVSIIIDYLPESFIEGFIKYAGLDPKLMIENEQNLEGDEEEQSQSNFKKKDLPAKSSDPKNKSLDMFFKKK